MAADFTSGTADRPFYCAVVARDHGEFAAQVGSIFGPNCELPFAYKIGDPEDELAETVASRLSRNNTSQRSGTGTNSDFSQTTFDLRR